MDQQTQLEYFARAVALLGGNSATARALGMNERSVRYLLDGTRRLHTGVLEDMAKALIAHADECRMLERKLSPAFASNLNEANAPPLHDGKQSVGKRIPKAQVDAMARKLGLKSPARAQD